MTARFISESQSPLADLFTSSAAAAPQGPRGTDGRPADLPSALRLALDAYVAEAERFPTESWTGSYLAETLPRIAALAKGLLSALEASLRAQPALARTALDSALAEVAPEIQRLTSDQLGRDKLGMLYRVRQATPDQQFGPADLSHIPFELTHLVRPQRYSVPGVPMLYLSSSLMACWEEMGRPDERTLWAAAFRLREGRTLRVLDLAYRPVAIAKTARPFGMGPSGPGTARWEKLVDYAVIWPLVIACSYRVLHRGAAFVPEYVLPQLLTSWLAERDDYVGVRYFSNRTDRLGSTHGANFALPAREHSPHGLCAYLSGLLEISTPYSWVGAEGMGLLRRAWNSVRDDFVIAESRDNQITYADTTFGRMESVLEEFGWPRDTATREMAATEARDAG